jgi:hypothetical protein
MTQIVVKNDNNITVQNFTPQIKGVNTSIRLPKKGEILTYGNTKIRLANVTDEHVLKHLKTTDAKLVLFNTL